MPEHYAVLRCKRVKSGAVLGHLTSHGRRTDASRHVDRSRSHLNVHWVPPALRLADPTDLQAAVDAVVARNGARLRKGASIAAEFHAGASPAFFELEDGTGDWDLVKIRDWCRATLASFNARFPGQLAAARLDMDESSPHLAIIVVPIHRKSSKAGAYPVVSFKKVFGGDTREAASEKMIELQDWYAAAMAPLGLVRGRPKAETGIVGLSHQQYRRRQHLLERQLREQQDAAIREREAAELARAELDAAVRRARKAVAWGQQALQAAIDLGVPGADHDLLTELLGQGTGVGSAIRQLQAAASGHAVTAHR